MMKDFGNDTRAGIENDTGGDTEPDYGGDIAGNDGVDLNCRVADNAANQEELAKLEKNSLGSRIVAGTAAIFATVTAPFARLNPTDVTDEGVSQATEVAQIIEQGEAVEEYGYDENGVVLFTDEKSRE